MSENRIIFEKLEAEFNKLQAQFKLDAEVILKDTFKNVFNKNPNLTAIVWTQYTPYFNDGDSCVFSVNDIHFTNVKNLECISNGGWPELDMDVDDEDYNTTFMMCSVKGVINSTSDYYKKERDLLLKANIDADSCGELSSMMSSYLMQDFVRDLFGESVMVVATREGFDVREIDHE